MPQHDFASVPNQWVDFYHDPVDLSALVYLIRTRNYDTDGATITVRQLAEKYHIGRGRAQRLMDVFRGYRDVIGTEPGHERDRKSAPGAGLRREPGQNRDTSGTEPGHGGSGGNVVSIQETRKKITTNARARVDTYTPEFERFWKVYPRREGKAAAFKAFKAAKFNEVMLDQVIEAVERHKHVKWDGKELEFVPHASTWLNNKRWEDESNPHEVVRNHGSADFDW